MLLVFSIISVVFAANFAEANTVNRRTQVACSGYQAYYGWGADNGYNSVSLADWGHASSRQVGAGTYSCMGDVVQGDAIGAAPYYNHWVAYGVYDHSWAAPQNGYSGYWRTEFGSYFGQMVKRSFGTRPQYSLNYNDVRANIFYRQFYSGY